jgi:hypothetical protein
MEECELAEEQKFATTDLCITIYYHTSLTYLEYHCVLLWGGQHWLLLYYSKDNIIS